MEIKIVKGEIKYLDDCLEALMNSELACIYLPDEKVAKNHLVEAFERKEMYLALDGEGKCVGYIRFVLNGIFYNFPYVCNISVKKSFRSRGIGKRLLEFFEDISYAHSNKVFLLVSSFNEQAKKLYESIGYKQVGVINDLYKDGISEYIMMKVKSL
ncbi:MAG TPA: N-acetyltransferase [Clostridium sp.]